MNIIGFINCHRFETLVDQWIEGELDEVTALAMARHAEECSTCAALKKEWQIYFNFMRQVGRSVHIAPETRQRIKQAPYRSWPRWRQDILKGFRWMVQPVQAATFLFVVVILSSLLLQPMKTSPRMQLGNVMTVEAHSLRSDGLVITYAWTLEPGNRPVTLTRSTVVLDCINRSGFTLFDPMNVATPYLNDLLTERRHHRVFQSWCGIIPRAEGWLTCEPNGSCRLELRP